ncbi:MAG: aminodeoxychorismate/anthranilate synthase component II [Candidatus Aureabacteria bacterium]|nr:aminodeoxychorismate/anthranilate synthase component II [Candidatus Auribacterota bacterium]
MILMIDNFDSFTWNLVQYLFQLGYEVVVYRNNAVSIPDIKKMNPDRIVISPGPGRPFDAGISMEIIRQFKEEKPILGVCLGHQAIGEVFGGKIVSAKAIMHGKISQIFHNGKDIFKDIPDGFKATRYHSLAIEPESFPEKELEIIARTKDGEIMGVRHRKSPVFGVQFHPESVLTEHGFTLLKNFCEF